jgi:hypothetical protein
MRLLTKNWYVYGGSWALQAKVNSKLIITGIVLK